jgi:rare lipoprotein A
LLGVGLSLLVADCASQTTASRSGSDIDPKYGVRASRRLYQEGEEIPKGGGQRLIGRAYTVAGRVYVPADVTHYSVVGLASWYGSAFHGRLTANGEVFDRYSISAAHKTLPLPSYARVTNIRNGRSIVVRINDRGPYHANRVMDVSERVADVLDFKRTGTTEIKLDYLRPAGLRGSDDRKLLATLRTDGSGATIDGAPIMVASADLTDAPQASGPGAPIAAIASAVSAAVPFSPPAAPYSPPAASYSPPAASTTVVASAAPVSARVPVAARPSVMTTVTYANGAGSAAPPQVEPAVASEPDDAQPAETVAVRNDSAARITTAHAPLPPERPYELGVTTIGKTRPLASVQPAPQPQASAPDGDDDEVVAPRPPSRPKQLATLFFASERLADTKAFIPGSPFAGLTPQRFVRLRNP